MATTLTEQNKEYTPSAWESVSCAFCGASDSFLLEAFGPNGKYSYVRCKSCGLAYLNPRPRYDAEFIQTAYSVYQSSAHELWDGKDLTASGKGMYALYTDLLKEMETKVGRRGSILEIGCSIGFFLKVASEQGWAVTGSDISPLQIEVAKKEFNLTDVHCADWLTLPLNKVFEVVYCSHTIEHIPNPVDWLDGFRRVLAPDGVICLEVPNMESADRRLKRLLKRLGLKKDKWAPWRTPDHLFEPCERSFLPFLERNGFEVIKVNTYSRSKPIASSLGKLFHNQLRLGSNLRVWLRLKNGIH
jgi:SAM-dependent methyltransferase